ncbi:MAG: GcvT family protein [Candidatus Rokuibacteriota bacterium]
MSNLRTVVTRMTSGLPTQARVVVVGGGIAGCSVAYHLAKLGVREIVLLERRSLTCGTTWHAAGLLGQLRSTQNLTRLSRYGVELYGQLEAETGVTTGFRCNGSVSVARTAERMTELRRLASMARCFGVEVEPIGPAEARTLWPLMRTDDLVGAVYIPGDAQTNPGQTALALAAGARRGGVTILEDAVVTSLEVRKARVSGVLTEQGRIACETVVNCGGLWAREIARTAGVAVPLFAAEHMYMVAAPPVAISPTLPVLRDADGHIYLREREGDLVMGGFEPVAKPREVESIPRSFAFSLFDEDWAQFRIFIESAHARVPCLVGASVKQLLNGPESFTPDTRYLLGEAAGVRGFFVAAGFHSTGIASAAGAGRAIAEWIVEGSPTMDLWEVDPRRFAPFHNDTRYLRERVVETVGLLYAMHWPFRQMQTARGRRRSPLHDALAARSACFGEVMGWERANWFAPSGVEPAYQYSWGRQNWFPHAAEEHRAVREAVGLFDQSSFAKWELHGPDAEAVLQRLCANDVGGPPGRVRYTAMLNERGGIECDLTVTRLAADRYFIVTGAAVAEHDLDWIRRNLPDSARVDLVDRTGSFATLGLMGPHSRALLSRLTDADLSNAAFPFASAQEITVAGAPVRALRITYVGELGWELYVPTEFAAHVFDALVAHGEGLRLRHAGYHAMDSLRCEKAYRSWGHDISSEDTPLEAELDFAVALGKRASFIGREALLRQREAPLRKRLLTFTLDDPEPLLFGNEPVWRDGALVGRTTSGAYGYTLGGAIALGYVHRPEGVSDPYVAAGRWELEVAGERIRATAHLRPPYDPTGSRPRA